MRDRMLEVLPRLALLAAAGLALLHLSGGAAVALEPPPPLAIFHHSVSDGLRLSTNDCAAALKALTAGFLVRSSITHVTVDARRIAVASAASAITEREIPVAPIGLIYTLEGPRSEVAILACAPGLIQK